MDSTFNRVSGTSFSVHTNGRILKLKSGEQMFVFTILDHFPSNGKINWLTLLWNDVKTCRVTCCSTKKQSNEYCTLTVKQRLFTSFISGIKYQIC